MSDLVVIFRAHSDIEASVVRGLLEAHGVPSVTSSDVPHSVFPLNVSALGEVRISVNQADAETARRLIDSHRTEITGGRVVRLRDEFQDLESAIGYRFRDIGLLEHALTHASRAHEDATGGVSDNESLEFLGDAVLGFIVADHLFHHFPHFDEGMKSKTKAALVSTAALARLAERLSLGEYLLLGRGEEKTGGRRKQALLADAYEALIAAIYLDGGLAPARAFVLRELGPSFEEVRRSGPPGEDHKSALQERLQAAGEPLPEYRLVRTLGPDHRKLFEIDLVVRGEVIASAAGTSRKEAEQEAARLALSRLDERDRGV